MDSKKPSGNEARVRRIALATVIALTAAWSSNALSRTQPAANCDTGHDLQNLTAPVDTVILQRVDHVPIEQDGSDLQSMDIDRVSGDTSTPLLNLAPHVNETLQGIFEDDGSALLEETTLEIQVSPVAESEEIPDLSELPDDGVADGTVVEDSDLPLLERQMYRIDI